MNAFELGALFTAYRNTTYDELLLLSSWFQRFPAELERTAPARRAG